MKTIKVIDLLNKIANGEEVPKKIKYDNQVFKYRKDMLDYYCYDYDLNLIGYQKILNDSVEIIEEDEKIEYPLIHKTAPDEVFGDEAPNWRELVDCNFKALNKTIYKLIDEINKLKEMNKND